MQQAPLQDIRVLDLTRVLAGPFTGMLLADLGADVIKIERPGIGDETRNSLPQSGGESAYFMAYNRNKRGLVLDLQKDEGKKLFLEMVKKSDVVLENFRADTMHKLGLDYDVLKTVNPKIIYASVSGYGHKSRHNDKPGYDVIAQAQCGMMSTTGWPGGIPTRTGAALTDTLAGLTCALSIVAALRQRDATGIGQCIDIALLDCGVQALAALSVFPQSGLPAPYLPGNRYAPSYPFDSFKAKDDVFVIGASNDKLWRAILKTMGREDLLQCEDYIDNRSRVQHHDEVKNLIENWASDKTAAEAVAQLAANGVPTATIRKLDEVIQDPSLWEDRKMFTKQQHPRAGEVITTGSAIHMSGHDVDLTTPAPALGQHTDEILGELFPDGEIDLEELKARGIINR